MSDERPVNLTPGGIPTTVLPAAAAGDAARLADALAEPDAEARLAAIATVVAASPRFLAGWAELGDVLEHVGAHPIQRYAAYRVGYHRGLDALRASGWRGSGYVRWNEPDNQGFLRALRGLGDVAREIGEREEADRIAQFLTQLDPSGPPSS